MDGPAAVPLEARAGPGGRARAALAGAVRLGLAPAAVYLLLLVLLTWPAALRAPTHLLGGEGDAMQNVWNLWWMERAAAEGRSPYWTDAVHHPFGASLRGHTLGTFNALVAAPLRPLLSREQAYNAVLALSFVASGVAAFLLAHRLTGSWPGALAAGFVFTFSHWHVARMPGHLNLAAAQFLPLFALAWLAHLDRPGLARAGVAAAAFALAGLCDLYFLVACALAGALLLAGRALEEGRAWLVARERVVGLMTFGALASLLAGPIALPVAGEHARDPFVVPFESDPRDFSADLLGLVAPGVGWRFAGLTAPLWRGLPAPDAVDVALGLPVLLLAAWVWRRRADVAPAVRLRAWVVLIVGVVLLGLGPELQVARVRTGVPLPWALVDELPPLKLAGKPARFMVVATLGTAVLTAVGVQRLLAAGRRRVVAAFAVALVVDHAPARLPTEPLGSPPAYVEALRAAGDGAVLDLASGHFRPLWHQTTHGRPMALGYLSRHPASVLARERPLIEAHRRGDWRALRERFDLRWLVVPAGHAPPNDEHLRLVVEDAGGRLFELAPRD
ncbi:MAG: hypothetical protein KF878_35925 [Planctomycetes bacterium]|nr:hypothetical protein [Planctomycetota bacterium]